jgi:flavodoxin
MAETGNKGKLNALIVYFSASGNTEKVAGAIRETLEEKKVNVKMVGIKDAGNEELYDYDLVFMGTPSYSFLPAQPVLNFIKDKMKLHRDRGDIKLCAPVLPGKYAVVFCTYSGPHTGIDEATPVGKYMGQFFAHIGYQVAAELYVVGEFHGNEVNSTMGRLGNIKGRPDSDDLAKVREDVLRLLDTISARRE